MKNTIIYAGFSVLMLACAANGNTNEPEETPEVVTTVEEVTEVDTEPQTHTPISEDVTAEKFKQLMEEKPGQVLDVRTPGEFSGGTIDGAVNMDFYSNDFSDQLDGLDKDQPVYVFCKAGGRSGKTKQMLTDKGFTEVYNLIGGYGSWPY